MKMNILEILVENNDVFVIEEELSNLTSPKSMG